MTAAPIRNITWSDPALVTAVSCHGQPPANPYATGYGRKIPTRYSVRYGQRWHRVYAMCYGNTSTLYLHSRGEELVLDDETEYRLQCHSEGRDPDPKVIETIAKYDTNRSTP